MDRRMGTHSRTITGAIVRHVKEWICSVLMSSCFQSFGFERSYDSWSAEH